MKTPLIAQGSLLPIRQVGAGISAGMLSVVVIAIAIAIAEGAGIDVSAELASAITTLVSFAIAWTVRERRAY